MNLDKLYLFSGGKSNEVKKLEKEREELSRQIELEKNKVTATVKSPGWVIIEKLLENQKNLATAELKTCKLKDVLKHQSDIKAVDRLFGMINSKIIDRL